MLTTPLLLVELGMGGALVLRMNGALFGMKRAHHDSLRVSRRILAGTGMTPARFDLVQVLARCAAYDGKVGQFQSVLWKVLGVSRATVSRMVGALEKLGLVRRVVMRKDRRQRWVELTREGAACFRLARRVGLVPAHVAVLRAVAPRDAGTGDARSRWWDAVGMKLGAFETLLAVVQWRLGGRAELLYGPPRLDGPATGRG